MTDLKFWNHKKCKPCLQQMQSRNYRLNKNGNSAIFFSYVCNGKAIKELFASTLNGITASVSCVSSMVVVLNAKFSRLLAAQANRKEDEKRFASWKTQAFNFYCSLYCAREHESIIFSVPWNTTILYIFSNILYELIKI